MSKRTTQEVTIHASTLSTLSQLDRALLSAVNACKKLEGKSLDNIDNIKPWITELLNLKRRIDNEISFQAQN